MFKQSPVVDMNLKFHIDILNNTKHGSDIYNKSVKLVKFLLPKSYMEHIRYIKENGVCSIKDNGLINEIVNNLVKYNLISKIYIKEESFFAISFIGYDVCTS